MIILRRRSRSLDYCSRWRIWNSHLVPYAEMINDERIGFSHSAKIVCYQGDFPLICETHLGLVMRHYIYLYKIQCAIDVRTIDRCGLNINRDVTTLWKGGSSMFFYLPSLSEYWPHIFNVRFVKYLPRTDIGVLKIIWMERPLFFGLPIDSVFLATLFQTSRIFFLLVPSSEFFY